MDNTRAVVQFINENGEFSFAYVVNSSLLNFTNVLSDDAKENQRSLVSYIEERANFVAKGTDYSIVAILGPQSSGKSV